MRMNLCNESTVKNGENGTEEFNEAVDKMIEGAAEFVKFRVFSSSSGPIPNPSVKEPLWLTISEKIFGY